MILLKHRGIWKSIMGITEASGQKFDALGETLETRLIVYPYKIGPANLCVV